MKERALPRARKDCLWRELDDEVVIYDPDRHEGHCLNATAAAVWKLCDGKNSSAQIAVIVSRQFSAQVDKPIVELALERLAGAHLLVEPASPARHLSRRVAIRRIGIAAAIALPLVTSVMAPTPAHAASCFPNGHACTSPAQCCSGLCGLVTGICGNILSPRGSSRR
jgi:hypothetical protein